MSKSDVDIGGTIFLTDTDEEIAKKFKRAVTDSLNRISFTDEQPGVKNLLTIQSVLTGRSPEELVRELEGQGYARLKSQTAEIVIEVVRPIRETTARLMNEKAELDRVLREGADKAAARAEATLRRVREAMGFIVV